MRGCPFGEFGRPKVAEVSRVDLDAVVYPTNNIPPQKIQAPEEPAVNGRSQAHWVIFGMNGFPTISVPAGFTSEVYDRVPDATSPDGTKLVGPVSARLPVGVDFAARFGEPLLIRIAAAYEKLTRHRQPPAESRDFRRMSRRPGNLRPGPNLSR